MAEITNTFEQGLIRVDNKTRQPQNSYSFALNAAPNEYTADRATKVNEKGFDEYIDLRPTPYTILGVQWLGREQYVFFIKHLEGSPVTFNEIWYVDKVNNIKVLKYSNLALNFDSAHIIRSTYRINFRGERLIYFVDGLNDDRVINIDTIQLTDDIDNISMSPNQQRADIKVFVNDTGGLLPSGQYFIAASYTDNNDFTTSIGSITPPVSISASDYYGDIDKSGNELIIRGGEFGAINGNLGDVNTGHSLTINIDNIDPSFRYLNLYIIQVINEVTRVKVISNITINDSSIRRVYTGNEGVETDIDLNDVIVDFINYYASEAIIQKENRLIRGNVKIKENLINYQQIANNIRVGYKITEELVHDSLYYTYYPYNIAMVPGDTHRIDNTCKIQSISPDYLAKTGNKIDYHASTFMRDEVYSLGIGFELNDGTETQVFHIPGRVDGGGPDVYNGNGTGEYGRPYTIFTADWDSEIIDGQEAWLSRNTAFKFNVTTNRGMLAYWRSDEVYPDGYGYPTNGEKDSNGKSYVRHHRMPSDVLEPIFRTEVDENYNTDFFSRTKIYRRNLALVISNVVIPEEYQDIITKVKLYYTPRTNANKRIISKGLLYSVESRNGAFRQSHNFNYLAVTNPSINTYQFVSPEATINFKKQPISGNRLQVNAAVKGPVMYYGYQTSSGTEQSINTFNEHLEDNFGIRQEFLASSGFYHLTTPPTPEQYSRVLGSSQFVDPNFQGSSLGISLNFRGEDKSVVLRTEGSSNPLIPNRADYSDLLYPSDGITGSNRLFPNINYLADQTEYLASRHISTERWYDTCYYVSIVNDNRNLYGNPLDLQYVYTGAYSLDGTDLIINGGDTFIEVNHIKKGYSIANTITSYGTWSRNDNTIRNVDDIKSDYYISYIGESDLNVRMRRIGSSGDGLLDEYYPICCYSDNRYERLEAKASDSDEEYQLEDFYNTKSIKTYFANNTLLSDFSNTNISRYSTRLIYSDKQNYEDRNDNYRIVRANNYRDLPMDRGPVSNLFVKQEKLYALTRDSVYEVYASNKAIQATDGDNITVGTGEFFGLEPVELMSIDGGYAGSSSKLSLVQSPYGYLFTDILKSKVILFNDSLKDLNLVGLNEDFTLNLYDQLGIYSENEFDRPALDCSIKAIYDPRLHRFIITKKDYLLLNISKYKGVYNPEITYQFGDLVFDNNRLKLVNDIGELELPNFEDPAVFENKSFTVSYDPMSDNWISYHSYFPDYYIQHPTDFIKHEVTLDISNSNNYQQDMPFILEVVFNSEPKVTKVFDSITWGVESEYQGVTTNDFFDELIAYNEQQSTGVVVLDNTNVTKKEKKWNFNRLLDISTNIIPKQLFTNDWTNISSQYYIDKVVNPASIDTSKPWYLRGRMRDRYLIVRFRFNNLVNKKIITNFVSSRIRASIR